MSQKHYQAGNGSFSYDIKEQIAILEEKSNGWTLQFNLVSYNDGDPKYDLRNWSPEGKMSKGVTLSDEAMKNLEEVIVQRVIDREDVNGK